MAKCRLGPLTELTQQRLKQVLRYEPNTGLFRWKVVKGSTAPQGGVAGAINPSSGYCVIRVDGRLYAAHRLAWLYVHGCWPSHQVDHINLVRSDNRWANLRQATVSENRCNRGPTKANLSGLKGVSRNLPSGWMARIKIKGTTHHLGTFRTPEEAHAAYAAAADKLHGPFARTGA